MCKSKYNKIITSQWIDRIKKELTNLNVNYDEKLNQNYEKIHIKPFYRYEDLPKNAIISRPHHTSSIYAHIGELSYKDYKNQVEKFIKYHAQGIFCKWHNIASWQNQNITDCLEFLSSKQIPIFCELSLKHPIDNRFYNVTNIHPTQPYDPYTSLLLQKQNINEKHIDNSISHNKSIVIRADALHNAGANITQTLAYTLAIQKEYLQHILNRGQTTIPNFYVFMASGSHFFFEIIKYYAYRQLWANVCHHYGLNKEKKFLHIINMSSTYNKTTLEPQLNILRMTLESMASIIGKCDAVCLNTEHLFIKNDHIDPSHFTLDLQHILYHEAAINDMIDAVKGSYFLEHNIHKIATSAWKLFQKIEKYNGFKHAVTQHSFIQDDLQKTNLNNQNRVKNSDDIMIGLNLYPNTDFIPPTNDYPKNKPRLSTPIENIHHRLQNNLKQLNCINVCHIITPTIFSNHQLLKHLHHGLSMAGCKPYHSTPSTLSPQKNALYIAITTNPKEKESLTQLFDKHHIATQHRIYLTPNTTILKKDNGYDMVKKINQILSERIKEN